MENLLKISLIISLLGILVLLIISNEISPELIKIKDIDDTMIYKNVKIQGNLVKAIKPTKGSDFQILTINDSTGTIQVTLNTKQNFQNLTNLIIIGKVTEYKNKLQINAEKIMSQN